MNEKTMQKLNVMGDVQKRNDFNDTTQVVEVQFPEGKKNYSYIGSGNLRKGQEVKNAPVTHYISGKDYVCREPVKVVATHSIVGAQIGDKKGVRNGSVTTIPTGLKFLPSVKEQQQDREVDLSGQKMKVSNYMAKFGWTKMQKPNILGEIKEK